MSTDLDDDREIPESELTVWDRAERALARYARDRDSVSMPELRQHLEAEDRIAVTVEWATRRLHALGWIKVWTSGMRRVWVRPVPSVRDLAAEARQ